MSRPGQDIVLAASGPEPHAPRCRGEDAGRKADLMEEIMIRNHPVQSLATCAVITGVLFVLSASGNSNWFTGPGWLGTIGWFGFLLGLLTLIVIAVYLAVARLRQRRQ
jgi:hypothetical protein